MGIRAILFDLGNTLVHYYSAADFPEVLRQCLKECGDALGLPPDPVREREVFEHALRLNPERRDFEVWPLRNRLRELFRPFGLTDDAKLGDLTAAFLRPVFALARVDATVFCVDVGWRKPHRAPFDRALSLLGVTAEDALFVGDDLRWDVAGAGNAGIRPVLLAPDAGQSSPDHLTLRNLSGILEEPFDEPSGH